jgi:hypothetical protein
MEHEACHARFGEEKEVGRNYKTLDWEVDPVRKCATERYANCATG